MTQEDMFDKITEHMQKTGESYPLTTKDERRLAHRLVECGQIFYCMDRDHVRSYERGKFKQQ